jgi:1-acyl-sn-glycerol-3-phosphate acyltransferase
MSGSLSGIADRGGLAGVGLEPEQGEAHSPRRVDMLASPGDPLMLLYRLFFVLGRPLAWLVFRPEVRGREHVPGDGGFVVAPTHLSGFDVLAMAYATPRPVRNMGKSELFRRSLLGPFVRSLGAFPARDEHGLQGGVPAAAALATEGSAVAIYPEGARRRGRERRPRTGAARAALAAGVPLVPAAIRGTDGWRARRRWQVAFGPPVDLRDLAGRTDNKAAHEATQRLWDAVKSLEAGLAG